ncbi:MAG: AAA family ATPase [Rhodoluna sp.]|nr:AAA family ATPase [Rhodoluna sp.]
MTLIAEAPPTRRSQRQSKPKNLRVITIWGAQGSGKSTIALNLAAELAKSRAKVLLIDADTNSPTQTLSLSLTEHPAGLAPMLRFARQNRLNPEEFESQSMKLKTAQAIFTLIPGINPTRWPEVTPQSFELLLNHATQAFDFVIIDTATSIEPGIYSQTQPLERNEFTRWLIKNSQLLIATFAVDPVSIARFLSLEPELQEIRQDRPTLLVANRFRTATLGPTAKRQLEQTFKTLTNKKIDHYLPDDPKAQDAALKNGTPLIGSRGNSSLRKAIGQLVREKKLAG